MLLGVKRALISVPVLYALMSVNEYATHRWYQHEEFNRNHGFNQFFQRLLRIVASRPLFTKDGRVNIVKLKGGGHVEHHAETYDDMSLKKDERWRKTPAAASLDSDISRGTAFSWGVTGLMTIQMLPTTLPVFALMGFSLLETFTVLLPGMLIHALVWNMLHPPMHGLPPVKLKYGAPSWPLEGLRNTGYFKCARPQREWSCGRTRVPRLRHVTVLCHASCSHVPRSPRAPLASCPTRLVLHLPQVHLREPPGPPRPRRPGQLQRVLSADRPPAGHVRSDRDVGEAHAQGAGTRGEAMGHPGRAGGRPPGADHRGWEGDGGGLHSDGAEERAGLKLQNGVGRLKPSWGLF